MIEYADRRNPTIDGTTTGGTVLATPIAESSAATYLESDNPECRCTAPQIMTEGSFPTSGSCCPTFLAKASLPILGLLGEQQSTATVIHTQSAPTSSMPNPSVHVMSTESNSDVGRTLGQRIMMVSRRYNLFMMSSIMCIVIFMQAAGDNGGGSNRDPPSWGPEQESTYPFREYSHDILLWIFQTNLQPHQQCAAIMGRLRGEARDLARQMSAEEIARGAVVDGRPVDSVTLLFHALKQRFAPLAEEARLAALNQFMNFRRREHEQINSLITRFETSHARAVSEGGFNMSYEGLSFMLIKIIAPTDQQLLQILQPFNSNFPTTQADFYAMLHAIRRMGHILEHHPGNISSQLRHGAGSSSSSSHQRSHYADRGGNNETRSFPAFQGILSDEGGSSFENPWRRGEGILPDTQQSYVAHDAAARGGPSQIDQISRAYMQRSAGGEGILPDATELALMSEEGLVWDESDAATSTDTSSDDYDEALPDDPQLDRLPIEQAGEYIYWAYRTAKKKWRRFQSHKPTRKVRRFTKRKGKGKGKGKGSRFFLESDEGQEAYWASSVGRKMTRKGKGKGSRHRATSGRGFNNPI